MSGVRIAEGFGRVYDDVAMGLICKEMWVIGRKGRKKVSALFDTGASHSLLRESIARAIADPVELPEPKKFATAVGEFKAREGGVVDVVLAGKRLYTRLTSVADLTEDLILGADFLQSWHIRLDPRRRRVILDPQALKLKAVGSRHRPARRA